MSNAEDAVAKLIDSLNLEEPEGDLVKEISVRFLEDQQKMRNQLLEAMSGYSENLTCASWITDLDRRLHAEGGIWEVIAQETGWPVDVGEGYGKFRWLTWQEAGEIYKHPSGHAKRLVLEVEAHGLNEEGHLKDCGA